MSRGTLDPDLYNSSFAYGSLTLYGWLSHTIRLDYCTVVSVRNPEHIATLGLASSAFARHY